MEVRSRTFHHLATRLILAGLLLPLTLFSQKISRKDVLTDLRFLNEAVSNGHPVNYMQAGTFNIADIVAEVEKGTSDSLSIIEYRFILGAALQEIGCVHTSVKSNPLLKGINQSTVFPLHLMAMDNKLVLTRQAGDSLKHLEGVTVLEINGKPSSEILSTLMRYSASDGGGKAFVSAHVNLMMPVLIAFYFEYPAAYSIRTEKGSFDFQAIKTLPEIPAETTPALLRNGKNSFSTDGKTGILELNEFSKSDKKFFRKVFAYIEQENLTGLVLDLRGNTGGNRKASVELTRYLVDTTFSYAILKPKLHTRKYLDRKGKLLYFLGRIKYGGGHLFNTHRTELGKLYRYKYKPFREQERYTGKIVVLTDGLTASAATMTTSWLKQHSNAVFAGTQAGGGYNGNNGGAFPMITLPASGIRIKFPAYRLILDVDSDNGKGLVPDFIVEQTLADLLNGKDTALQFALDRIRLQ